MADLSERGQILLIAGFALAATFVGLALVLNSVIYTENLATRSESTTAEPLALANSLERGTTALLVHVNEEVSDPSSTYTGLEDSLETGFGNLTDALARHGLAGGLAVDDELGTVHRGTWLRQTNESRNFTDTGGTSDWRLVDGADGARSLRLFVNDSDLLSDSDPFTVTVEDSSVETWKVAVKTDEVVTNDGTTCTAGGTLGTMSTFWVNVSTGTVGGVDCPGLKLAPGLGAIDQIVFRNASNVNGTYRVLVNKSKTDIVDSHYSPSTKNPFRQPALYAAVVQVDVEQNGLVYQTDVQAEPGESDG